MWVDSIRSRSSRVCGEVSSQGCHEHRGHHEGNRDTETMSVSVPSDLPRQPAEDCQRFLVYLGLGGKLCGGDAEGSRSAVSGTLRPDVVRFVGHPFVRSLVQDVEPWKDTRSVAQCGLA